MKYLIFTVLILCFVNGPAYSQEKLLFLGAGASPLHFSSQNDFNNKSMPVRGFLFYKKGRVAAELSYESRGSYLKDRFSFTHTVPSASLLVFAQKHIETNRILPYLKAGINYKTTAFTTEGYPGITGYELKVEKDQSVGFQVGSGVRYLLGSFLVGLEANYSKSKPAQFLAGGFSAQALNTDQFTLELNIAIPLKITSKRASLTACPNL